MTITVFSRPDTECRACWSTKRRMAHHGVKYETVMLDGKTDEQIVGFGYTSAPVVVVTDDANNVTDHWGGFREEKIAKYRGE